MFAALAFPLAHLQVIQAPGLRASLFGCFVSVAASIGTYLAASKLLSKVFEQIGLLRVPSVQVGSLGFGRAVVFDG
jgi:hypothetical protein